MADDLPTICPAFNAVSCPESRDSPIIPARREISLGRGRVLAIASRDARVVSPGLSKPIVSSRKKRKDEYSERSRKMGLWIYRALRHWFPFFGQLVLIRCWGRPSWPVSRRAREPG